MSVDSSYDTFQMVSSNIYNRSSSLECKGCAAEAQENDCPECMREATEEACEVCEQERQINSCRECMKQEDLAEQKVSCFTACNPRNRKEKGDNRGRKLAPRLLSQSSVEEDI